MTNREELRKMTNLEIAELLVNAGGACDFCGMKDSIWECSSDLKCVEAVTNWLDEDARI